MNEPLHAHLDAGRAAWPGLAVPDDVFVAYLRERFEDGAAPPLEHAADLFIACACAIGAEGAAAAFERAFRATLERAVARVERGLQDEGTQVALVSLLVATPEGPARIASYSGRSSLRAWLATVAARGASKLRRRKGDQPHESLTGLAEVLAANEPELALARARHGPELAQSLRTALGSLEPRQAVLLRLHHAKGWSVDRLGALYRVGRSTAARWVAAARQTLVENAKRDLRDRLGLTASELESLVALLQSNLELSLVRLLDDAGVDPEQPSSIRSGDGKKGK
jgi:RNA polymerase sigma-70 factor (ECF subfamily)